MGKKKKRRAEMESRASYVTFDDHPLVDFHIVVTLAWGEIMKEWIRDILGTIVFITIFTVMLAISAPPSSIFEWLLLCLIWLVPVMAAICWFSSKKEFLEKVK